MHILKLNNIFYNIIKNSELKDEDKEDVNVLRKWQEAPRRGFSNIHKFFLKHNIIQINDRPLGSGKYSTAFEVVYKGRHAVAKVTKSIQDYFVLFQLNQIREADSRIRQNLVKAYDFIYDRQEGLYIMIVEYLTPTHIGLISDLWSNSVLTQYDKEKEEIVTIENIQDFVKKYLKSSFKEKIPFETMNSFFNSAKFFNLCKEFHKVTTTSTVLDYEKVAEILKSSFLTFFNDETLQYERLNLDYKQMVHDLTYELYLVFNVKQKFPISHEDKARALTGLSHPDIRVRKLMNSLFILKNEYNINWEDLHNNNIMMRPKTNELVISDPGLFSGL